MKAAVIHEFDGIDSIEVRDIPKPEPKEGELLIEIKAAGVNPVDWKIADGLLNNRIDCEMPVTLGWDCSGVVVDPNGSSFKKGDTVYAFCRKQILHDGAYAEYLSLNAEKVCYKPKNLSFEEAATIPLSALTAWQSLVDKAHIKAGQKVLIHAGAGGVGSFAIQIAKLFGCLVITTASHSNHEYCKMLGADEVIDYQKEDVTQALLKRHPEKMDMVYNTVGEEIEKECFKLTKKGGWLVSITSLVNLEQAKREGIRAEHVFVQPNRNQLEHITQLIESEKIKPPILSHTFPLERVADALRLSRERHVQGKLVISFVE